MSQALRIQNLKKTYSNGVIAPKGVSLSVKKGDFFALLGPNGAGKSTLIGIVSGLVNKTSGDVVVNGISIDVDIARAKRNIGVVPQEFNFGIFEKVIDIVVNQAGYYGIPRYVALPSAEKYLKNPHSKNSPPSNQKPSTATPLSSPPQKNTHSTTPSSHSIISDTR